MTAGVQHRIYDDIHWSAAHASRYVKSTGAAGSLTGGSYVHGASGRLYLANSDAAKGSAVDLTQDPESGTVDWVLIHDDEVEEMTTIPDTASTSGAKEITIQGESADSKTGALQIYVRSEDGRRRFNRERNLGIYDYGNYADHYDDWGAGANAASAAERAANTDAINAAIADAKAAGGSANFSVTRPFDMDGDWIIDRPNWEIVGAAKHEVQIFSGGLVLDGDASGDFMRNNKVRNLQLRRRVTDGPVLEVVNNGADAPPNFNSPIFVLLEDLQILGGTSGSTGILWHGGFQGQIVRCYVGLAGVAMGIGIEIDTVTGNTGGVAANALEIIGGEVKQCDVGVSVKNSFKVGMSANFTVQGVRNTGVFIGENNRSVHINSCYFEQNGEAPTSGTRTDQNCHVVVGDDNNSPASTTEGVVIRDNNFLGSGDHAVVLNKVSSIDMGGNTYGDGLTHGIFNKRPALTAGHARGEMMSNPATPHNQLNGDGGIAGFTYVREAQSGTVNVSASHTVGYDSENQILRAITASTVHTVNIQADTTLDLPIGFEFSVWNQAGGSSTDVTPAGGVQLRKSDGTIGTLSVIGNYNSATIRKVANNIWIEKR